MKISFLAQAGRYLLLSILLAGCSALPGQRPASGFVELQELFAARDLPLAIDVRYAGSDNFVGEPIDGYAARKVYISEAAGLALVRVAISLQQDGLGLKVFDAYRPQRAVNHFVRWAQDLDDIRMKDRYYPQVDKANLFRDGYIAERSGHSRGSTVDLTLVRLGSGSEIDMGSRWDFFDPLSWPSSREVSNTQYANRQRLRAAMLAEGFQPLAEEWWHFTLAPEAFPDQYFDFPIR